MAPFLGSEYTHTNNSTSASAIGVTAVGGGAGIYKVVGLRYSS